MEINRERAGWRKKKKKRKTLSEPAEYKKLNFETSKDLTSEYFFLLVNTKTFCIENHS